MWMGVWHSWDISNCHSTQVVKFSGEYSCVVAVHFVLSEKYLVLLSIQIPCQFATSAYFQRSTLTRYCMRVHPFENAKLSLKSKIQMSSLASFDPLNTNLFFAFRICNAFSFCYFFSWWFTQSAKNLSEAEQPSHLDSTKYWLIGHMTWTLKFRVEWISISNLKDSDV